MYKKECPKCGKKLMVNYDGFITYEKCTECTYETRYQGIPKL